MRHRWSLLLRGEAEVCRPRGRAYCSWMRRGRFLFPCIFGMDRGFLRNFISQEAVFRSVGFGADTMSQENEGLPEGWEARKDGQVHAKTPQFRCRIMHNAPQSLQSYLRSLVEAQPKTVSQANTHSLHIHLLSQTHKLTPPPLPPSSIYIRAAFTT
jgi:hypothetical protein